MNATDLKAGTRVTTSVGKYAGRTGTVNGVDAGEVTIPGHENFGRKYIGVSWDAVPGDMGCDRRSRPFVDELTIVQAAPLPTLEDVEFWTDEADREDARREAAGCTCPRGESNVYAAHHRATCTPNIAALANRQLADPETVAEIHAARCRDCKGAGCPVCGYKGRPRVRYVVNQLGHNYFAVRDLGTAADVATCSRREVADAKAAKLNAAR